MSILDDLQAGIDWLALPPPPSEPPPSRPLSAVLTEARSEIEKLRLALATAYIFIEGEPIADAVVVPEGKLAGDPGNMTLLALIDAALDSAN